MTHCGICPCSRVVTVLARTVNGLEFDWSYWGRLIRLSAGFTIHNSAVQFLSISFPSPHHSHQNAWWIHVTSLHRTETNRFMGGYTLGLNQQKSLSVGTRRENRPSPPRQSRAEQSHYGKGKILWSDLSPTSVRARLGGGQNFLSSPSTIAPFDLSSIKFGVITHHGEEISGVNITHQSRVTDPHCLVKTHCKT